MLYGGRGCVCKNGIVSFRSVSVMVLIVKVMDCCFRMFVVFGCGCSCCRVMVIN